jgi:hypothetical protein
MGNILYILAVMMILAWAISYFGYGTGGIIHLLPVAAVIIILLRAIRRKDKV